MSDSESDTPSHVDAPDDDNLTFNCTRENAHVYHSQELHAESSDKTDSTLNDRILKRSADEESPQSVDTPLDPYLLFPQYVKYLHSKLTNKNPEISLNAKQAYNLIKFSTFDDLGLASCGIPSSASPYPIYSQVYINLHNVTNLLLKSPHLSVKNEAVSTLSLLVASQKVKSTSTISFNIRSRFFRTNGAVLDDLSVFVAISAVTIFTTFSQQEPVQEFESNLWSPILSFCFNLMTGTLLKCYWENFDNKKRLVCMTKDVPFLVVQSSQTEVANEVVKALKDLLSTKELTRKELSDVVVYRGIIKDAGIQFDKYFPDVKEKASDGKHQIYFRCIKRAKYFEIGKNSMEENIYQCLLLMAYLKDVIYQDGLKLLTVIEKSRYMPFGNQFVFPKFPGDNENNTNREAKRIKTVQEDD